MGMHLDFVDECAHADLLWHIAVLPGAKRVAWSLPECALQALALAQRGQDGRYRLRLGVRDMEAGQVLFSAGLVEARGPYLTNFGMAVRRHAITMIAYGAD